MVLRPTNSAGDVVDILRLDDSLKVVLQQLGEIVLQFATSKVYQNFVPTGRVLKLTQIGFLSVGKNFQGSRFTDTVGTN